MPDAPERPLSATDVRNAVRGVMAAFPKGTRFAACKTRILEGNIEVEVTVAPESAQPHGREARLDEIKQAIREKAGARS